MLMKYIFKPTINETLSLAFAQLAILYVVLGNHHPRLSLSLLLILPRKRSLSRAHPTESFADCANRRRSDSTMIGMATLGILQEGSIAKAMPSSNLTASAAVIKLGFSMTWCCAALSQM